MEILYQYLHRKGFLERETTKDELEEAKQQYRKLYLKEYQKEFRRINIRKDIYFTPIEFSKLSSASKKFNMPLPRLCKELTLAYLNNQFLLPDDTQIRQLEIYLRGVTNNINQLVRYIHQQKRLSENDLSILRTQINEMEERISLALRQPLNIQEYLENQIPQKPEILSILKKIIENHKHHDY